MMTDGMREEFKMADTDGSGEVSREELEAVFNQPPPDYYNYGPPTGDYGDYNATDGNYTLPEDYNNYGPPTGDYGDYNGTDGNYTLPGLDDHDCATDDLPLPPLPTATSG
jgi:hypothetical protein